ncbi:MAG: ABC transporter substrate-binding protein [Gammaproteobacteria bacterium]|nr:MAG: ABC transporter substrate-binding protein [Gammaproteobacteria bacterium]PIE35450.1 MAG: ABC transporter substrate-binding protein [Gammaproteobacteria bacterium]
MPTRPDSSHSAGLDHLHAARGRAICGNIRRAAAGLAATAAVLLSLAVMPAQAVEPDSPWEEVLEEAKGQTLYFHAWGGSEPINDYIAWVGEELESRYEITLEHVPVADISEVVGQLEAAGAVGRDEDGSVDLMWVNGENFAALKRSKLLFGAFADNLPNAALLQDDESLRMDFSVPVEGLESPWGGAQLVFIHDAETLPEPPKSAAALLEFVRDGGRFDYPAPPAFHGTTLLKQLLHELAADTQPLSAPVEEADFEAVTAPLWSYLDELNPLLRGKGKVWPQSGEATRQLLDDGEVDIALSFNPNEASSAVARGLLPDTVRTYVFDGGTIGNTHYVTIPRNASARAAAMVAANFLISPEAQARKADPAFWGDPTVLDVSALDDADKALFDKIDPGVWALPIGSGSMLPEPHASWTEALEKAWQKRYGS